MVIQVCPVGCHCKFRSRMLAEFVAALADFLAYGETVACLEVFYVPVINLNPF